MKRLVVTTSLLACALVTGNPSATAQDKIELKASAFAPPTHGWFTDVLNPWAQEVEKRTNGRMVVRIFAGNSPFGNVANQSDQVKAGVTDIGWGLNGVPRGRLPRTLLMDLPLMAPDAYAATNALWAMLPGLLAEDYKEFKVLALHCHNAGDFFLRDKKIDKLEDLKGLRIRAPSSQVQAMLQFIGATPVTMGPAQLYESLEKGTIDGISMVYDGVRGFRLEGLIKHAYSAQIYTTCFHVVMNPKKYESLPADLKQVIDETTGAAWVKRLPDLWTKWDDLGRGVTAQKGLQVVAVSERTRAQWRSQLKPLIDQQIAETEKQGVPNARQIYDEMVKQVARFSKR
jgi:TRAP-type C4-dicarboxylate transport system substrate-binding protein